MRVLDLFSGTHSVGKICKELAYKVISLDIDGRADITVNILVGIIIPTPPAFLTSYGLVHLAPSLAL